MTSPDTLPGGGAEPFADNLGNHPEPFCQQVGMADPKHGFRQVDTTRPAQGNGTAIPVGVHTFTRDYGFHDQPTHVGGGLRSTTIPDLGRVDTEQPDPDISERDGVSVHDTWVADKVYRETNVFREDWRMGEYDDDQHEQRREQADDNRPNLLRRWLDRALGMGTPGEWASDFAATLTLAALFACLFVFATIFGS